MADDGESTSGVRAVTAYLAIRNARAAIDFYAAAFGARQMLVIEEPDGRIGHATLKIGAVEIYVADEHPEVESCVGPETLGGTAVILDLEVDDVEGAIDRAVAAGAQLIRPPDHPTSGVQAGKVRDPFGHIWLITRIIDGGAES